ncbi:MAG: orotate phosphoribosyltransferase [Hyphomicrobiaceae bacterium]|nr:orotate phosphoribosyltransferase [Hyphomicrobiaceae bacterium]
MSTIRTGAAAARLVVESGAVYTRTGGEPFFFTSGWASPVFIDVKRLISLPEARGRLITLCLETLAETPGNDAFALVAGCELAGVPFAAMIADRLGKSLVVVRKQGKGFGRLAQFEGTFEPGERVLLVDDLATDGVSKVGFRQALERAEATVVETFVLLDYGIFPSTRRLLSLMSLADVIAAAEEAQVLDGRALDEVKAFAADAPQWSRRNGGIASLAL